MCLDPSDPSFIITLLFQDRQIIHLDVKVKNFHGILSTVYGSPNPITRCKFWDSLSLGSGRICNKPWIGTGDFNSMMHDENKRGGCPISKTVASDFSSCIQDCGLFEMETRGPQFTWESRGICYDRTN